MPANYNFTYTRYRPKGPLLLYALLIITIVLFSGWQLRNLLAYPSLEFSDEVVTSGFNDVTNNIFTLSGRTNRVAYLYLNQVEQPILSDNTFEYELFVPAGKSVMNITVIDRYRRSQKYTLQFYNSTPNLTTAQKLSLFTESLENFDILVKNIDS